MKTVSYGEALLAGFEWLLANDETPLSSARVFGVHGMSAIR